MRAPTDDFETVFAVWRELQAGGLVIGGEPFFNSRSEQLGALSIRHSVPAIYQLRAFAAAGGLVSYGGSLTDSYRICRASTLVVILKGEKPADLPVQRATKVEMIINLRRPRRLALQFPNRCWAAPTR